MATPNLLHLFATAIQAASALSGEMRFSDLSAAFKMTCELQQYIVNASFRRPNNTNSEPPSATTVKPEPDYSSSVPTSSGAQTTGEDSTLPSSTRSSTTDELAHSPEDPELLTSEENTIQIDESSLASTINERHESGQIQKPVDDIQGATINRCTKPEKRHRMVALETLHPDQVQRHTPCEACRLRMGPSVESFATMACSACPKQPPICSAQCFRWWHNRFPELLLSDHSNMYTEQENSLEQMSYALIAFPFQDTAISLPAVNKPTRPVRRPKSRRRKLQLTTVKRAVLRRRCARRPGVLRAVRTAVALDSCTFANIYEPPANPRSGALMTCIR